MENTSPTTATYSSQPAPTKSKRPLIFVGIIILLGALIGGFFFFQQSQKPAPEETQVTPTEPVPTEKPQIDKSSVKIQVVNGTGTPGQASKVVDALKVADYSEDNIKTGNAEEFDTLTTTITARKGFEDVASDIKDILEKVFDKVDIDSSSLEDSSDFDIVIVTGGKKFEAITPTASTTKAPTSTITPTTAPTATPKLTP